MRKIKKRGRGWKEEERKTDKEQRERREKATKEEVKRAGIFFGKSGKPKRPVEFHTMAFYTTVKRTTYLW